MSKDNTKKMLIELLPDPEVQAPVGVIAPITFLVPNIRSAGSMPPRPRA